MGSLLYKNCDNTPQVGDQVRTIAGAHAIVESIKDGVLSVRAFDHGKIYEIVLTPSHCSLVFGSVYASGESPLVGDVVEMVNRIGTPINEELKVIKVGHSMVHYVNGCWYDHTVAKDMVLLRRDAVAPIADKPSEFTNDQELAIIRTLLGINN